MDELRVAGVFADHREYGSVRESERAMNPSLEKTLVEVWRQALVENANVVELGTAHYPIRRTTNRRLPQVVMFAKTPARREINNIAAAVSPPICYKS